MEVWDLCIIPCSVVPDERKFRHTTLTRPMDRRNDPIERVRAMIDQLTYLQLMVVIGMLSDELSWRYRMYQWQEVQPSADTPPPLQVEDPSEPEEEVAEEIPPPRVLTEPPGPPPNWQGEPPWKRRRR